MSNRDATVVAAGSALAVTFAEFSVYGDVAGMGNTECGWGYKLGLWGGSLKQGLELMARAPTWGKVNRTAACKVV